MKHTRTTRLLRRSALVLALLSLLSGTAFAQTALVAIESDWNGVPMWGFAADTGQACTSLPAWEPGPAIEVDLTATTDLVINLRNCLADPVSIIIPGQGNPTVDGSPSSPSFVASPVAGQPPRAASLVSETQPGQTRQYLWSNVKPGTVLYSSGSQLSQQVHMGLYGAAVVNVAAGEAYPGVTFDRDIVVLLSEVDPGLHATASPARALNFKPKYFLVNGDESGTSVLTDPTPAPLNSTVLLRFVNAGLKSYVPTLLGEDMDWIAEDGNLYPFARRAYSAFLAAGQTMDAIWVPTTEDRHPLFDRRLHLTSNGYPLGGMRAFLDSGYVDLPIASISGGASHIALGTPVQLTGSATGGSLTYSTWDWSLVAYPAGSGAFLVPDATDPSIVTLTPDVPGTYTVELVVTDDGGATSSPATANVFTNLPPVAAAGADRTVFLNDTVSLDGTLSYDPDGDAITSYAWAVTAPNASSFVLAGATSSFPADQLGTYTVELTVSDGELTDSDVAYITVTQAVNQPPIAGNDYFQVIWKTSNNVLYVLANDSDPDGVINPASVAIGTIPMAGASATPQPDGTILYTPKTGFKGTDFFTYWVCDSEVPAACSEAEVLVNVVK